MIEVRNDSFIWSPAFIALFREFEIPTRSIPSTRPTPEIADVTSNFIIYIRLQKDYSTLSTGLSARGPRCLGRSGLKPSASEACRRTSLRSTRREHTEGKGARRLSYVIHEGKVRAPAAAMELIKRLTD